MSDELRRQILFSLNHQTTEELLAIWVANDRQEWSSEAFDVIQLILEQRSVKLPAQREYPPDQTDLREADLWAPGLAASEAARLAGTPAFYHPVEALRLIGRLRRFAPYAAVAALAASLTSLFSLHRVIASYFLVPTPLSKLSTLLATLVVGTLVLALQGGLVYFLLRSTASVLEILVTMEMRSRVVGQATVLEGTAELVE